MGAALNYSRDHDGFPTDEQVKEVAQSADRRGEKFGTADIRAINGLTDTIYQQIDAAFEQKIFNKDDRNTLRNRLQSLSTVDQKQLESFAREVNHLREEMAKLKDTYHRLLHENSHLFAKDGTYDAEGQYFDEFIHLSSQEKKIRFEALTPDLRDRQELQERARKLGIPVEEIARIRRSTLKIMVEDSAKNLERCGEVLQQPLLFSSAEKAEIAEEMQESTGAEQDRLMQKLKNELEKRQSVLKSYQAVSKKHPQFCLPPADFYALSFKEREKALQNTEDRVMKGCESLLEVHDFAQDIADDSKTMALAYIKSLPLVTFDNASSKLKALESIDGQFDFARQENREKFDKPLAELIALTSDPKAKAAIKARETKFYSAKFAERENMKEQLVKDLAHAREHSEVNKELTKKYFLKLDEALKLNHINKRTHGRCKATWADRDMKEKQSIVADFDTLTKDRVAVLIQFKAVVRELKKAGVLSAEESDKITMEFSDLNQHKRGEKVQELKAQLKNAKPAKAADLDKSTPKNQDNQKPVETLSTAEKNNRITHLTQQATLAQRALDWQQALECYEAILELDANDSVALMGLMFVQQQLDNDLDDSANAVNDQGGSMEVPIDQAAAERIVILEQFGDLAATAEQIHKGTTKAQDRDEHLDNALDREVAERLASHDEGVILDSDGYAHKVAGITLKDGGLHANEADQRQQRSILRDTSHLNEQDRREAAARFQVANDQGQTVSAKSALQAAEDEKDKIVDAMVQSQEGGSVSSMADAIAKKRAKKALERKLEDAQNRIKA